MEYAFIELFCGIGGFRYGLEKAGWKCVWANDIDKHACTVYRNHYGSAELVEGDIRNINAADIPNHTLLVAGFPCQSFSIAGKREGFEDTRGTLFFEVARIIQAKRPNFVLLENVKGLLSAQEGYCFARIIQTLDEMGYDVQWQVLDSKYFGVPQHRERVFIIGHLRDKCTRQIFPIGTTSKMANRKGEPQIMLAHDSPSEIQRIYDINGIAPTIHRKTGGSQEVKIAIQPCLTPKRMKRRQNGRRFKNDGEPMFTLTNQDIHDIKLDKAIRCLTPKEYERLQAFPDNWTNPTNSDLQRYNMCGNAVTTKVIEFLAYKLMELAS